MHSKKSTIFQKNYSHIWKRRLHKLKTKKTFNYKPAYGSNKYSRNNKLPSVKLSTGSSGSSSSCEKKGKKRPTQNTRTARNILGSRKFMNLTCCAFDKSTPLAPCLAHWITDHRSIYRMPGRRMNIISLLIYHSKKFSSAPREWLIK